MVIFFLSQTQISWATWSISRKSCDTSCTQDRHAVSYVHMVRAREGCGTSVCKDFR